MRPDVSEISGTKEIIFDSFVEMTSRLGYENVSIREIAKKVGIKPASIYNHFESKEMLLKFVYEYYLKYYYDNRKSLAEMNELVETASPEEFIRALPRTFETRDEKHT